MAQNTQKHARSRPKPRRTVAIPPRAEDLTRPSFRASDLERGPEPDTMPARVGYDPGAETLVLVGMTGPLVGHEFPIPSVGGLLGRGPGSTFSLDDPGVSRRHLRLTPVPDPVRGTRRLVLLQDLNSRNGVRVNGMRVRRKLLRGGEKVMVGETVLRFERRDTFDAAFYTRLQELATTDPLTGVANRLSMTHELERQESERDRYGRPYCVLLVDLDRFKHVNDRHGHAIGDRVLREIAGVLLGSLRGPDRAFRYGGEEFLVLVPETAALGALKVAERIRDRIEKAPIRNGAVRIYVTASIGAAEAGEDDVLLRADRALYQAKRAGRNCVRFLREPALRKDESARKSSARSAD